MAAVGADIQVVGHFAVKQHGAAFIAFGPQVVRRFATRKDRVDPGPNVIVDPVHIAASLALRFPTK
jgi:hypothetical protein